MGLINGFIQASAVLASHAQQVASRLRSSHRDRLPGDKQSRPRLDEVELSEAIQGPPESTSVHPRHEHAGRQSNGASTIDIRA